MLLSTHALEGFTLHAYDGDIGHVDYLFFDDKQWKLRYLAVKTGNWLSGRKVLISPVAIVQCDLKEKAIHVSLSKEQVRNSPEADLAAPVSRHFERDYFDYYTWPYYWSGSDIWGAGHVRDFILESDTWTIQKIVVESGHWPSAKTFHLRPALVDDISWSRRIVEISIEAEKLKEAA